MNGNGNGNGNGNQLLVSVTLYALIALSTAIGAFLGSDDAAKFISAENLFWARGLNSIIGGVSLTLKGVISQTFAEWVKERKNGNGAAKTP